MRLKRNLCAAATPIGITFRNTDAETQPKGTSGSGAVDAACESSRVGWIEWRAFGEGQKGILAQEPFQVMRSGSHLAGFPFRYFYTGPVRRALEEDLLICED